MNILEFNKDIFGGYSFAGAVLNEYPTAHLHMILAETTYVVYDADTRVVVDVGKVLKENWIHLFADVFKSDTPDPWALDDSFAPITITPEGISRCTEGCLRNEIPDITNALNATVLEVNSALNNIKYCLGVWPARMGARIHRECRMVQEVADGYITWALQYDSPTGFRTLLDLRFSNESVKGYPRSRIHDTDTPMKLRMITDVLGGYDTMYRGISGIEYEFSY